MGINYLSISIKGSDTLIGIYKIMNLVTGEIYIGQSKDIDKRLKEHICHSNTTISMDK